MIGTAKKTSSPGVTLESIRSFQRNPEDDISIAAMMDAVDLIDEIRGVVHDEPTEVALSYYPKWLYARWGKLIPTRNYRHGVEISVHLDSKDPLFGGVKLGIYPGGKGGVITPRIKRSALVWFIENEVLLHPGDAIDKARGTYGGDLADCWWSY